MKLKKKHVWQKPRVRVGEAYVEASERKPFDTFCVFFFPSVTLISLVVLALVSSQGFSIPYGIAMFFAILFGLISAILVLVYRPPRVLRIYPGEQVAHAYRRGMSFKPFGRWHDLSGGGLSCYRVEVLAEVESDGGSVLGILSYFAGPLGLVLWLGQAFVRRQQQRRRVTAYALRGPGLSRPLALVFELSTAQQIVELYQAGGNRGD